MFSGQPVFPSATGVSASGSSFTISNNQGITIDQIAALLMMHAMVSNVNNLPETYAEMAENAKRAAAAIVTVL